MSQSVCMLTGLSLLFSVSGT